MNKHITVSSLLGVMITFSAVAAPLSFATTMEQHQSFSSEVSSSCSGECSFSSHVSGSQHQFMSDDSEARPQLKDRERKRGENRRDRWTQRYGEVKLTWSHRGGTCHVRYTEANVRSYRYSTNADCDEGGVTIGGLTRGKAYRFQVKQDDGYWSRAFTRNAW